MGIKYIIVIILILWPITRVLACSLVLNPVDRFDSDTFVYSAKIVNIASGSDILINSNGSMISHFKDAGGLILEPIDIWNQPERLNLHAVLKARLLPDCSYKYENIDVITSTYSIGDTVAVVARSEDSKLWNEHMTPYPVLVVLPYQHGSLANARLLNPKINIDKTVTKFSSHLEALKTEYSEFRSSEKESKLNGTEFQERIRQINRSIAATRMRENFEIHRNLANIHHSESHDERMKYLTFMSYEWYGEVSDNTKHIRRKYDCGFTSLVSYYFSYSSMAFEIYESFQKSHGRTLPTLNDCISDFNMPFSK